MPSPDAPGSTKRLIRSMHALADEPSGWLAPGSPNGGQCGRKTGRPRIQPGGMSFPLCGKSRAADVAVGARFSSLQTSDIQAGGLIQKLENTTFGKPGPTGKRSARAARRLHVVRRSGQRRAAFFLIARGVLARPKAGDAERHVGARSRKIKQPEAGPPPSSTATVCRRRPRLGGPG